MCCMYLLDERERVLSLSNEEEGERKRKRTEKFDENIIEDLIAEREAGSLQERYTEHLHTTAERFCVEHDSNDDSGKCK